MKRNKQKRNMRKTKKERNEKAKQDVNAHENKRIKTSKEVLSFPFNSHTKPLRTEIQREVKIKKHCRQKRVISSFLNWQKNSNMNEGRERRKA